MEAKAVGGKPSAEERGCEQWPQYRHLSDLSGELVRGPRLTLKWHPDSPL